MPPARTACGVALLTLVTQTGGTEVFGAAHPPVHAPATVAADIAAPDVGAELAAAAIELARSDPRAALLHLRRVAEQEPDNPWLHYYEGAALLQLHEPYEAMAAFDRASERLLTLGDPDPALRERIAAHRVRARREVFSFDLDMGLAYDTNVTFTGTGGEEFGFISGRSDGVFGTRARFAFAPLSTGTDVLAFGLRTAQSWYFRVHEFDYQEYAAAVRYIRRLDEHWEALLAYAYDFSLLDRQSYLSLHALTVGLDHRWRSQDEDQWIQPARLGGYYRIEAQDFLFDTPRDLDRDGWVHVVGIEQQLLLRPVVNFDWTWDLHAGYAFSSVHTEGVEFDHKRHGFYLRVGMPLVNPRDANAYLFDDDKPARLEFTVDWQRYRFDNPSVFDDDRDRRHDLVTNLTLRLSQLLHRDPRYGEVVLHAIIAWSKSDSNVVTDTGGTPFSYERTVYGLQLAWSW